MATVAAQRANAVAISIVPSDHWRRARRSPGVLSAYPGAQRDRDHGA